MSRQPLQDKVKFKDPNAAINITVASLTVDEVFFKIKRNAKLSKLQSAYANEVGKDVNSIRFLYDGKRIHDDDTPLSLGMKENDTITDVMTELYDVDEEASIVMRMPRRSMRGAIPRNVEAAAEDGAAEANASTRKRLTRKRSTSVEALDREATGKKKRTGMVDNDAVMGIDNETHGEILAANRSESNNPNSAQWICPTPGVGCSHLPVQWAGIRRCLRCARGNVACVGTGCRACSGCRRVRQSCSHAKGNRAITRQKVKNLARTDTSPPVAGPSKLGRNVGKRRMQTPWTTKAKVRGLQVRGEKRITASRRDPAASRGLRARSAQYMNREIRRHQERLAMANTQLLTSLVTAMADAQQTMNSELMAIAALTVRQEMRRQAQDDSADDIESGRYEDTDEESDGRE